ncbi:hypothetical protein D3C76_527620 [compost metagenome]
MLDPRIQRAGRRIDTLEQFDLFRAADDLKRIVLAIQALYVFMAEDLYLAILAGTGNRTCRAGSLLQCIQGDGIAVGKPGFLTRLRPYADALVKIETAFLDDAVLQRPGLGNLPLEVQVGRIDAWACQLTQHRLQVFDLQATGCQQVFADTG